MIAALGWLGARARLVLAAGVVVAMLVPALSAALRPALPALVVLIFAVATARMDMGPLARDAVRPRRLVRLGLWTAALLGLTPLLLWLGGRALGLGPEALAAVVYTGAAPPITSAAALCLILGLDAVFALELTVLASLATPLVGPLVAGALLGAAVPLDPAMLALRLGAMILLGIGLGAGLRRLIGPARIAAHARAFDGVAALVMILFVVPLFDGFWSLVAADPGRAGQAAMLALLLNTGVLLAVAIGLARVAPPPRARAAALVWGNRTVAIYLAALPPEPFLALYVALYQVPMLFTPLVMERVFGRRSFDMPTRAE